MDAIGSVTSSVETQVVLYGKPGCHLCEDAYTVLRKVQQEQAFQLTLIDIQRDPDLFARFSSAIPVIEIDGRHFCQYHVDEARFRERLQEVK